MADVSKIAVQIASEFTGSKAFKQADTAAQKLQRTVKNLAASLGVAFSVTALVNFSKASVKAFTADAKAATILTNTLTNMGLAFEDSRVKNFISDLESATGVLDDSLRPAMQALLTTTGNVTKSQELLGLAVNVSAGSGVDLVQVANDLSQAFVGNTKGLKKYNLGLTQTELKTTKFSALQEKLTTQFSGSNAALLDTYAGKLSLIGVAYANMQETIGKGLVDSFALLAGDNGIGGATKAMEDFGKATAETLLGVATLLKQITPKSKPGETSFFGDLFTAFGGVYIEQLRKIGRNTAIKPKPFTQPMSISGQSVKGDPLAKARTQAEKLYLARLKSLNTLTNITNGIKEREIILTADEQALMELQKKYDMDRIQIGAALNGVIDQETQWRLLEKLAIIDNNGALAQKIAAERAAAESTKKLAAAQNEYASALIGLAFDAKLNKMMKESPFLGIEGGSGPFGPNTMSTYDSADPFEGLVSGLNDYASALVDEGLQNKLDKMDKENALSGMSLSARPTSGTTINYTINASGVGDQQLAAVVQNTIQNLNRYGSSTTYAGAI